MRVDIEDEDCYYEDDMVIYKDDPYTGTVFGRWPNGNLCFEKELIDGMPDGLCKWWYQSGALKEEVNFRDGKREVVSTEYNESGKLKLRDRSEFGTLLFKQTWDEDGNTEVWERDENDDMYDDVRRQRAEYEANKGKPRPRVF